ncbi:MAG: PQQ-dependent sugar dehydrogenase [Myxococcota bacterium]
MTRHATFALAIALTCAFGCGESDSVADVLSDAAPDAADVAPDATPDAAPDAVADATPDADAAQPPPTACKASEKVANAYVPEGFCASAWATGLGQPRGIFVAPSGDVLVVERQKAQVTVLWDDDGDRVSGPTERALLAKASGLNHGVTVHGGFLYASSATTVFRWAYADGARSDLGAPTTLIKGIPSGGHSTRTLVIDAAGLLYVSVGSAGNVDSNSDRSRIRRFPLASIPESGVNFADGEVFADGLRNEVGLDFDGQGRLWGVQNGVDNLQRADLGGDIHDDNPAEELSLFDTAGRHYGYPYCWSEFILPAGVGDGPGAQWAHPQFINDGTHTDAWCKNPANVVAPQLAMQAHAAPLDLEFYDGAAFPADYRGDLFISFHGSWNRTVPTGYKVVRVHFDNGKPQDPTPFFEYSGAGDIAAAWPHRPVGVRVGKEGQLFVTSDGSGTVFVIGYDGK